MYHCGERIEGIMDVKWLKECRETNFDKKLLINILKSKLLLNFLEMK